MYEANRLKRLPLYLFTIIDELKKRARQKGIDIIDLGMGNPDTPTPKHIVDELCRQAKVGSNHRYSRPNEDAEIKLREAIAHWYRERFAITLDPYTEVLPLIGSKEGIAHLSLALLNNDDIAIVPNPAYPVHFNGVIIAGGILYNLPLTKENNFLPNIRFISKEVLNMTKLMFLSYPHNPTTAVCDIKFFEDVIGWAKAKDIVVGHDLTYSDIVFDGYKAPSILQVKDARDVAIEFHTLSKSYNMAGWRIGFAVGNSKILKTLEKLKSYVDFGIFKPIQYAAIEALTGPQDSIKELVSMYKKRRDVFVDGLNKIGWHIEKPKATFYVWAHIPLKFNALTSMEFATLLIEEAGIATAPGTGFGEYGEGYVRFALVEDQERLKEAVKRIKRILEIRS